MHTRHQPQRCTSVSDTLELYGPFIYRDHNNHNYNDNDDNYNHHNNHNNNHNHNGI